LQTFPSFFQSAETVLFEKFGCFESFIEGTIARFYGLAAVPL